MSVSIVRIPPAPDGSKQGVDDYLAAGGDLDDLEVLPFEEGWIPPRNWPTLAKDALQGLAGEVLNTIAPNTESDPVAILALFLAAYGNMIGRGAHFVVEGGSTLLQGLACDHGGVGQGPQGYRPGSDQRAAQAGRRALVLQLPGPRPLLRRGPDLPRPGQENQGGQGRGDRRRGRGRGGQEAHAYRTRVRRPPNRHATGGEHPLRGPQDGLGRHHLADPDQELAGALHH